MRSGARRLLLLRQTSRRVQGANKFLRYRPLDIYGALVGFRLRPPEKYVAEFENISRRVRNIRLA